MAVASAALLVSFVLALLPKGKIRAIFKFCGALLLILVVITPLTKLDVEAFAQAIAKQQMQIEQMRTGVEINNREILSELIKQQSEAYVLDKAESLGITVTVDITLNEEGDYPYPGSVILSGNASQEDQQYLSKIIAEDIGVPTECQEWR